MSYEDDQTKANVGFKHKATLKKPKPWYENAFWGPLAIAMIGAFIAASAQITATILPITFGPANLCDFSITIYPGTDNILVYNNTGSINISESIIVSDLHKWIKPYRHPVYVKVASPLPSGVVVCLQNKAGTLPLNIVMNIKINNSTFEAKEHEIIIQGIGEDGLTRNCTYFLNLQDKTTTKSEEFRVYSNNLPTGVISYPDSNELMYVDPIGNSLTRSQYIAKYHIDPKVELDNIYARRAIADNFDTLARLISQRAEMDGTAAPIAGSDNMESAADIDYRSDNPYQ